MSSSTTTASDTSTIRRLRVTYIAALSLIAVCLMVFAGAMLNIIPSQNDDAHVVNISGRQRMLSQRLFKVLLLMSDERDSTSRRRYQAEIADLVIQWEEAHRYLRGGDSTRPLERSDTVARMLRDQDPHFQRMLASYRAIATAPRLDSSHMASAITTMKASTPVFLDYQERITNQFQREADQRLERLSVIAIGAFIVLFTLLIAEWLMVFRPMTGKIERYIASLTRANKELLEATRATDLSEQNMRRLLSVYPDLTIVFDENGVYTDIFTSSDHLLYRDRAQLIGRRLHDVFPPGQAEFFLGAIQTTLKTLEPHTFTYELPLADGAIPFRATTTFFDTVDGRRSVVMFVRNIASEVAAEERERRYQKQLLQTIIDTQESERARIAADMHDGIGQMFAVLKLNIASLKRDEDAEGFDDALVSIDTIVNEFRTIAWNLMPASLVRFGLASTLKGEAEVLQRKFGIQVEFQDETNSPRYPDAIEVCVFRIAQELLTNIARHSRATRATVRLIESNAVLTLDVEDNGCGFSPGALPEERAGRGLISIHSRIHAVGGTIDIHSSNETGTRIRVQIPVPESDIDIHDQTPHDRS